MVSITVYCLARFLACSHGMWPYRRSAILQENAQLKQLNAEAEERTRKANQRQQADVHKQVVTNKLCSSWWGVMCTFDLNREPSLPS